MIVGRDVELARVTALIAAATAGDGGLVVVTGATGAGKSTIVHAAIAATTSARRTLRVVRVTCTAADADVAWAGLSAIAVELHSHLDQLGTRPRDLLAGLVGWGPTVTGDQVAIGMACLALLIAAADTTPLVVVVDDARHLDPESRAMLEFVARRLHGLAVALVIVSTGDEPGVAPSGDVVVVDDLDRPAALALLGRHGLATPVAADVVDSCGTRPRVLVDVARRLSPEQRNGAAALPDPLPTADTTDLTPDERRAIHRHLAATLEETDPPRARWHRAQAAEAPDADLADELEQAADDARSAGQVLDAYRLLGQSARLSPPRDQRRRRLATIDAAIEARLTDAAATLLCQVGHRGPDTELREARLRNVRGDLPGARAGLLALVDDPAVDPTVRTAARVDAAALCLRTYDLLTLEQLTRPSTADPAAGLAGECGCHEQAARRLALLRTAGFASIGDPAAIDAVVEHTRTELERTLSPHELVELAESFAIALARAGRRPELFRLSDVVQRRATERGTPSVAPCLLIARAAYLGRTDLVGALEAATGAVALIEELRHFEYLAQALTHRANALAGLADPAALDVAARIEAYGGPLAEGAATLVRAAYHRTTGDLAALIAATEATHWRIGRQPQLSVLWHLDLFEAALALGRHDLVTDIHETLTTMLAVTGSAWVRAGVDRIDGLLATDLDTAVGCWRRSAATFDERGYTINAARTELVWAERLVREGDHAAAHEVARRARVRFAVAGMPPWIARCDAVLAQATGGSEPGDGGDELAANRVLTHRELQVARWLVEGSTYRQIAERLFVSSRTVESHCGAIYRKLGVRGRSGLAARALSDRTLQMLPAD